MQHQLDICGAAYNLIRIYNQLLDKLGLNEENIIKETEKLCKTTNTIKITKRTQNPIFIPEKIELPLICTSFLEKEKQNTLLKKIKPKQN